MEHQLSGTTIYLIPIEPIESRYTKHWYEFLPKQLELNLHLPVVQVSGVELDSVASSGAFLNFTSTVNYKGSQINKIAELFHNKKIKNGDIFICADAWNPSAHMIRYMADLSEISIKMVGIWHAGSYDEWDFLGRNFKNKDWSYSLEKSLFELYDSNIFATHFHKDLFLSKIKISNSEKAFVFGFPMEYYESLDIKFKEWKDKKNIIVFPHRISVEKNSEFFDKLSKDFPQFQFVYAQKVCQNKHEYHRLLEDSKIVFSANLQETLGISMYEGLLAGAIPLVPSRLSYKEMYSYYFKYNGSYEGAISSIYFHMNENNYQRDVLKNNILYLNQYYFSGYELYKHIGQL